MSICRNQILPQGISKYLLFIFLKLSRTSLLRIHSANILYFIRSSFLARFRIAQSQLLSNQYLSSVHKLIELWCINASLEQLYCPAAVGRSSPSTMQRSVSLWEPPTLHLAINFNLEWKMCTSFFPTNIRPEIVNGIPEIKYFSNIICRWSCKLCRSNCLYFFHLSRGKTNTYVKCDHVNMTDFVWK